MDKLTIIEWSQGIPNEKGRYFVQIYSGAVDIDYYNNIEWEKYSHKEIIMWSKITKLEENLKMSRPLTAIEGIDYVEEKHNITITKDEIVDMHRREYKKLISKNKEELVRMIMGDDAYFDAFAQITETSDPCFHAKENTEENYDKS